jgi:DNA-binding transcriptional MerR regulator
LENFLPPIPTKRYFTISEVSSLCSVKPHVLRYWEQEFTQLRPMKRRGNRRYYQRHEVLMIRKIRDLLYEQGFTITGARNKLQELVQIEPGQQFKNDVMPEGLNFGTDNTFMPDVSGNPDDFESILFETPEKMITNVAHPPLELVRRELLEIRDLLSQSF